MAVYHRQEVTEQLAGGLRVTQMRPDMAMFYRRLRARRGDPQQRRSLVILGRYVTKTTSGTFSLRDSIRELSDAERAHTSI